MADIASAQLAPTSSPSVLQSLPVPTSHHHHHRAGHHHHRHPPTASTSTATLSASAPLPNHDILSTPIASLTSQEIATFRTSLEEQMKRVGEEVKMLNRYLAHGSSILDRLSFVSIPPTVPTSLAAPLPETIPGMIAVAPLAISSVANVAPPRPVVWKMTAMKEEDTVMSHSASPHFESAAENEYAALPVQAAVPLRRTLN